MLIKSLASSDRNWKTKFFFVFGFWVGNPVDIGRDTFAPYNGDLGNLRPEGTPSLFSLFFFFRFIFYFYMSNLYLLFYSLWTTLFE